MPTCAAPNCKTSLDSKSKLKLKNHCELHQKCTKCKEPTSSTEPFLGLCKNHQRLKVQELEKIAREKQQMEDKLKETEEARKQMAEKAKKLQEAADAKKEQIKQLVKEWSAEVNVVVKQVKALRSKHPERSGINAGTNDGLPTTLGGVKNPIRFTLPSPNPYKITQGEVVSKMPGFDSSDSGDFKFRIDSVLVHAR